MTEKEKINEMAKYICNACEMGCGFDGDCDEGSDYKTCGICQDTAKKIFEEREHIEHSKCYSLYGLNRSGCAGCPFGSNFENELKSIEQFEPKLYKAVNNIFKDSYLYTRQYRKFKEEQK